MRYPAFMRILDRGPGLLSLVTRRSLLPPPESPSDDGWMQSWHHLGQIYAPAMRRYAFHLLKRWHQQVPDPDEPEVIVQGFLAKCMESGQLAERNQEVRTFRGWIAKHLQGYVKDYLDHKYAKKRRAARSEAREDGLNELAQESATLARLDAQLDQGWVQVALGRAQAHLRAGVGTRKWGPVYAGIIQDLLLTQGTGSEDLHERLGVDRAKLPNLKNRARARFAELFVDELRTTVRDEESLGALLRSLAPYLP